MKNLIFNRKSLLFSTLLATTIGLNAQIKSSHTDEKYNYTTVVYKDTTATDKEVLSALDRSIGMGDVIRITVAPPKPAVVPSIDKSKGEDIWLKPANKPAMNMTASSATNQYIAPVAKTTVAVSKAAPAVSAKAVPVAAKPVVKKPENLPSPVVVGEQNLANETVAATPVTVKTKSSVSSKTTKSAKKAVKKGGRKNSGSYKLKNRKKGKQRYGCAKF